MAVDKLTKLIMRSVAILLCAFLLGGCLERTEMDKIGVIAGLGVDKADEGFNVTIQVLNPEAIKGDATEKLAAFNRSEKGRTIFEALQKLDNLSTQSLFLTHLNIIVVAEDVARESLFPVLDFALRHTDVRPNILLEIAKGISANEVLNVMTPLATIPISRLDTMNNMLQRYTGRMISYNLYEINDLILTNGMNVAINAVSVRETMEDDMGRESKKDVGSDPAAWEEGANNDNVNTLSSKIQMDIKHLAIFNRDKLIGFIDDEEAQYYNIIMGNDKQYTITTTIDEEYRVTFATATTKSKINTMLEENRILIDIELGGILRENGYPLNLDNGDNLHILEVYLAAEAKKHVEALIERSQKDFRTDFLSIGNKAYYSSYHEWKTYQAYWDELYPDFLIDVKVDVSIDSTGEIGTFRH